MESRQTKDLSSIVTEKLAEKDKSNKTIIKPIIQTQTVGMVTVSVLLLIGAIVAFSLEAPVTGGIKTVAGLAVTGSHYIIV